MQLSYRTDIGCRRSQNQDAVFACEKPFGALDNIFVVADGMGGHNAGDYASKEAIKRIKESILHSGETSTVALLRQGITTANQKIYQEASEDETKLGMGTTIVVATMNKKEEMLHVANVGDSRLYVLTNGKLEQITKDHSVIGEMVRKGEVTKEQARIHPKRNMITRAVGAEPTVCVDMFDVKLREIDAILMCTDGLTSMVDDERIQSVLASDMTPEQKVDLLITEAKQQGGLDNITVLEIESFFDEVKTC